MDISPDIKQISTEMTAIRHDLHRYPQVGFCENFASTLVQAKLKKWGIEHEAGIAKTGVVATIHGKSCSSNQVIGLRADMDALPIQEMSDTPWKSTYDGVMHACGHDGHTSILLGTAAYLQANRDSFNGTVKLIFQPAEEGIGGALLMLEEGLIEKHAMDSIYALHNWPDLPVGEVGMRAGPIMAASNRLQVDIMGQSGHAAFPHNAINAGIIAAEIYKTLSTLFTRLSLDTPYVVTPTVIDAGGVSYNTIPGTAIVKGTTRTLDKKSLSAITAEIESISNNISAKHGGKAVVTVGSKGIPTVNDLEAVKVCSQAAAEVFGSSHVHTDIACAMTAEDFAYILDELPGAYMWLGQGISNNPDSPHNRALHNNRYDFNDAVIPHGIALFSNIVKTKMPALKP